MFELFINNKKELSYAENSLLNSLFMLQNMKKNVMEVPEVDVSELFENIRKINIDDVNDSKLFLQNIDYYNK